MTLDPAQVKERVRATWSLGDYDAIAPLTDPAAEAVVEACAVSAGQEVLDVGAGTGNLAVRAARQGAAVVAADLTPALLEKGRARAEAEGLAIEWVLADVEELPFEDGRFDCVASVFGAIFAPRPERAAAELARVARPGGSVAIASWAPDSFMGHQSRLAWRYLPPPEGLPHPFEWGDEEIARRRLGGHIESLHAERRSVRWRFESPAAASDFFESYAGPHVAARQALDADASERLRRDWIELARQFGTSERDGLVLEPEYLLVVGRKRG